MSRKIPTRLLRHSVTIKRATVTRTGGESSVTYSSNATGVKCLIQQERGQVKRSGAGAVLEYDAIAFFPQSTDLQPGHDGGTPDQVVVTSPPSDVATYLVKHVADTSGQQHHRTAYLTRHASSTEGA